MKNKIKARKLKERKKMELQAVGGPKMLKKILQVEKGKIRKENKDARNAAILERGIKTTTETDAPATMPGPMTQFLNMAVNKGKIRL